MRLVPALVSIPSAGIAVLAMLASVPAQAQAQAQAQTQTARPRPGTSAPVPATAAAPVVAPPPAPTDAAPPGPQQTTATFEDWTLRCTRLPAAAPAAPGALGQQQFCELVQTVSSGDKPVAQIAIGRPTKGQPLLMTVLTPVSVSFTRAASLITQKDGDASTLDLGWHRCIPGGCLADAPITDELMRRIQVWTEPARIVYADAAGRPVALPFSAHGLPTALGALNKADAE